MWPSARILITYILINCEWFVIKLCGKGIILSTDLLCGIASYYFSIDLRFDCIFNDEIRPLSKTKWLIFISSIVYTRILISFISVSPPISFFNINRFRQFCIDCQCYWKAGKPLVAQKKNIFDEFLYSFRLVSFCHIWKRKYELFPLFWDTLCNISEYSGKWIIN